MLQQKNKLNVSIDDVSPHEKSSIKVVERCFDLIKTFPDIKFSLFVPISYWRTVRPEIATKNPLRIDLFPDFCKYICDLPKKNFEICYHGFYHGIPGKNDNDEFRYLNYKEATIRFEAMRDVVKLANLDNEFKMIFRPPAWKMSSESIRAARDFGIKLLALNNLNQSNVSCYSGEQDKKDDVVYMTSAPPFHPLDLKPKTEVVYHACEWDKNYLCKSKTEELKIFLEDNIEKINFCFLEEFLSEV